MVNQLFQHTKSSSSSGITEVENRQTCALVQELNNLCKSNDIAKQAIQKRISEILQTDNTAHGAVNIIFRAVNQYADDADKIISNNPFCLLLYFGVIDVKTYQALKRKTLPYTVGQADVLLSQAFMSQAPEPEEKTEKTLSFFPTEDYQLQILDKNIEPQLKQLEKFLQEMPDRYQQQSNDFVNLADRDSIKAALIHSVLALQSGISQTKLEKAKTLLTQYSKPFSSTKKAANAVIEYAKNELESRADQSITAEKYKWLKFYVLNAFPTSIYYLKMEKLRTKDLELEKVIERFNKDKIMTTHEFKPSRTVSAVVNVSEREKFELTKELMTEVVSMCVYIKKCFENELHQDAVRSEALLDFEKSMSVAKALSKKYGKRYPKIGIVSEVDDLIKECESSYKTLVKLQQKSHTKEADDAVLRNALDGEQKVENQMPGKWMKHYAELIEAAEDKLNKVTPARTMFSSSQPNEKTLLLLYANKILSELKIEFNKSQTDKTYIIFSTAGAWDKFKEALDKLICQTAIYKQKNGEKHDALSSFIQQDIINLGVKVIEGVVKNQQKKLKIEPVEERPLVMNVRKTN